MEQGRIVDVNEKLPLSKTIPLGLQHLFAMFGATVLVPLLVNQGSGTLAIPPAVALLTSGIGTWIFILATDRKVPSYLGSSFAFIAPLTAVAAAYGPRYALGGTVIGGLLCIAIALLVKFIGTDWLDRVLPPVVIGSVIIVIGLGLAPTAVDMAGLTKAGASLADPNVRVSLFTLVVAVIASVFFKGFLAVIPVLIGVVAGYIFGIFNGIVDFQPVMEAAWFAIPRGHLPAFSWEAAMVIVPVAFVTIAEHLGDIMVVSRVVGRDFFKDPGLHKTLLGDGLAETVGALLGGPPSTTYGENIGVMAITKVYSVWVIGAAATMAIILSFVQKFAALIQTIPSAVMGGISIMLFGVIASSGLRTLVESGIDYSNKRNLIISSVILVFGIGGATVGMGRFQLQGMALATIVGILLNLVLPKDPDEKKVSAR